ncbi:hypothetical protein JHK87_010918 [Glycine soja]|nr:hypothetical protein JHK87_010918 [Glycine soja]
MEGLNLVSTRLGDNLVLLSPLVGEDLKNMIDGAKEWLKEIFEYIVPWSLEQATGNQKMSEIEGRSYTVRIVEEMEIQRVTIDTCYGEERLRSVDGSSIIGVINLAFQSV